MNTKWMLLSFCSALFASAANADYTYMGHCTDDPAVSAEDIVSACTGFISRAFQENWQLQDVPAAMVFQATAYERLGNNDKAAAVLKAAVTRYRDYGPAWVELGELLEKLKGPGILLSTLDLMIRTNPDNPEILNEACWVRATKGEQLDAAIADCNAALQINPDFADALDSRAFAHFRRGEFAQAISDANSVLAQNAKSASSLYVRGLAKLKSGDAAGGNADVAAAKAMDAKIADTYSSYGVRP